MHSFGSQESARRGRQHPEDATHRDRERYEPSDVRAPLARTWPRTSRFGSRNLVVLPDFDAPLMPWSRQARSLTGCKVATLVALIAVLVLHKSVDRLRGHT